MGDTDVFGWGIAGTGSIARTVGEVMAAEPGMRVAAVGSRTLDRAENLAKHFDHFDATASPTGDRNDPRTPRAHGSYAELVEDPDVHAVYIATPHAQHLAIAELAIAAGKAVLCEKPLTVTVADAERLLGLARAAGVFVMEAMWMRFNPLVRRAADLVAAGGIGELRSVTASFGFPFPYDPTHRLWAPELGGGALLDLGVYPVALAHLLLGAPESISVTGSLSPTGVDAEAALLLGWPGGARALLETSLVSPLPMTASIIGTTARIDLDAPFHATTRMVIHHVGGTPEEHTIEDRAVALAAEVREVRDCVTAGRTESTVVPHADTLAVLRILADARSRLGAVDPA